MNTALVGFLIEAPLFGISGFYLGRFLYATPKGIAMLNRLKRRTAAAIDAAGRGLDWIAHQRRLAAFIVALIMLVLAAYGYTYKATTDARTDGREAAASERAALVECIGTYVFELSKVQAPRTAASVAASDARRDWDRGFSTEEPNLTKAQLKDRYLRAYAAYVKVRVGNPIPSTFSLDYCKRVASDAR